ncbi:unnamed protein product [Peronospora destructor]|uniref:Uncharacterized protein n=1 Tax=Peronospora destructor TaxID=86335 RepID=A0AAV0THM1_9STRA|nr:unnamed protein product [Peronospora destructor]
MILACKCKRHEQRKLLNGKNQSIDSDSSDNKNGGGERESFDMEEQLTAFVEYDATNMDNLEINPSQDFNGDEEKDTATQVSQRIQSSSWEDVTDVDQYQNEASECFDNVVYAPQSAVIPSTGSTLIQGEREFSRPFFRKKATVIPEHGPLSDDSEGSLSDGFDIAVNLANAVQPALQPASISMHPSSTSPNVASKVQWRQRRSVKRDCSLIDNFSNYSVNGRLLLTVPPIPVTTSKSSSDGVIELKDGCFDSSDDAHKSRPARKRRKVDQLTLDGFFRPK